MSALRKAVALELGLKLPERPAASKLTAQQRARLRWGIRASMQQMLLTGFTPVTHTYTSGTSVTETIPGGATKCTIKVWGAGASGSTKVSGSSGAGGGGGYSESDAVSVVGGKTFTYTVGTAGAAVSGGPTAGNNGTASSVVAGTQALTTMTANGGVGGTSGGAGGAGGTASGGTTTNASGSAGTSSTPGLGGANGQGSGGGNPGGQSPGAGSASGTVSSTAGGGGQVQFIYT